MTGETRLPIAAVLAPVLRDRSGELRLLLVVRGDHGVHGGQLRLPGGKPEAGDADLPSTALREAHEEVGLDPAAVEVVGALDPLDTPGRGDRVERVRGSTGHGRPGRRSRSCWPCWAAIAP